MSMLSEFREFAVRGNMVDMAVGIIIGGAFGTIVKSLVSDVIMPPIGLATGGIDFSEYKITLAQAAGDNEAVTMNIGVFINNVISFLIVAMAVFLIVKAVNAMRRQQQAAPPAATEPTATEQLLTEIRDELKKSQQGYSTGPAQTFTTDTNRLLARYLLHAVLTVSRNSLACHFRTLGSLKKSHIYELTIDQNATMAQL